MRQVDAGHADLGKSGGARPPLKLVEQGWAVQATFLTFFHPGLRHLSILETRRQHWTDEADCAAAAAALARRPGLRDAFIELHGPLGAGKTTFARHLLRALGVTGRIKSPTYAVLETYEGVDDAGGFDIRHFDFYRFDDPQEWEDAGFRDVFASPGLTLAEWPQNAGGLLPPADLQVFIDPVAADDAVREVRFVVATPLGRSLFE